MSQTASSINYRLGSLYSVITAFLYATQEPFSFPAAKHLNTLQFVALTQVSLLVSIPLLMSRSKSRRDFVALIRKPINYGYLGIIFAIGLTGLLLYNFGLSNAHPDHYLRNPQSFAILGRVGGAGARRRSDPDFAGDIFWLFCRRVHWRDGGRLEPARRHRARQTSAQLADSFLHGSWLYAIPVPLASALGGTLVGKWFGAYDESAAIAANFLTANVILIPGCLALLYWRNELNFDQLGPILLMIFGTIVAASLGRVMYQIALTVTGGDNGFVTMFLNLVPALTAFISLGLSHWVPDLHFVIDLTFFLGSGLIAASLVLFSLKSWRQPARGLSLGRAAGIQGDLACRRRRPRSITGLAASIR